MAMVPTMATIIMKIIAIIRAHKKIQRQVSERMKMVHQQMMRKMMHLVKKIRSIHKMVEVVLVRVQTQCQKRSDEKNF